MFKKYLIQEDNNIVDFMEKGVNWTYIGLFHDFFSCNCIGMKVLSYPDPTLVHILMCTSSTYIISANTFKAYNNTMLHSMWRTIERTIIQKDKYFTQEYTHPTLTEARVYYVKSLIGSRSSNGFQRHNIYFFIESNLRTTI